MFTHHRRTIDLNGTWKFNPDPYQRCRQQQWWKNPPRNDSFFPCWDSEGLWEIQVPGTWKAQFPELKWYDGDANYMRDFEAPEIPENHEAFLVFDGVIYSSEVFLNGLKVGQHDWGYSPFAFRVTEYLRAKNRLFVLVENKLKEDRVPGIRYDWNNDGGIINGVKLVFVPRVFVKNFRTATRLEENDAVISVDVWLDSRDRSAKEQVTVQIPELGLEAKFSVSVGDPGRCEFRIPFRQSATAHRQPEMIRLWSPEDPKLYETRIATRHETLLDEVGYREVRTEGQRVLLNGKPIRLYGLCIHSDFPGSGRTATLEGIEKVVGLVRELGCNFLRCAHYPYAEIWGRAMDRAGILWWEEVPVYWLSNVHEPRISRLALGMMGETIQRDWNRASLIFWSLSNECANGLSGSFPGLEGENYPYWVQAAKQVRELDPSRLLSSADSGHRRTLSGNWSPDRADTFDTDFKGMDWIPGHPDELYDLLDVLSGNVYVNNLGDGLVAYHKFAKMLGAYNKPIMVSEFGSMSMREADERPGSTPETLGSEARHAQILREAYRGFHDLPEITGYMPWCLADVRVPMHWRWYNAGKAAFSYGLLDLEWRKKKVFDVVKAEIACLKKAMAGR